MTHKYTVVVEREPDGGFHVSCPALHGCHTQGETIDKALANAEQAISLYLESMITHNEMPPVEDILIKPIEVAIPA